MFRFMTEDSVEVKVIEKAYKKLALDALVIQQGRLQDSKPQVGKDDLLQMVRYGAEKIFSGAGSEITSADIDTILTKGEAETAALSAKMNTFKDAAMKFSLEGDKTLYDFESAVDAPQLLAEGDAGDGSALDLRRLAATNWAEPEGRKKKMRGYNENEYFRNALQHKDRAPRPAGPRFPALPKLADFQFFALPRIQEIQAKEEARIRWEWDRDVKAKEDAAAAAAAAAAAGEAVDAGDAAGAAGDGEEGADEPPVVSDAEREEKAVLLTRGFSAWQKRDFLAFIRAAERHGRHSISEIAAEVDGKTEEEVAAYSAVFWRRVGELTDAERIVKNIEKGEQKIQRQIDVVQAIARKLGQYTAPSRDLRLQYGNHKGKAYTEEEDRFLLCAIPSVGYGNWEELKALIRTHWMFRFDWFFKSRTPTELGRRVEVLVRIIEKGARRAEFSCNDNSSRAPRLTVDRQSSTRGQGQRDQSGPKRAGRSARKKRDRRDSSSQERFVP